ncbi:MAG: feruloyl-CoA synthase [Bryobacteraceae bacterium]
MSATALFRPVDIASWDVSIEQEASGAWRVSPVGKLGEYPVRVTDALDHWAAAEPERTFLAKRGGDGEWVRLTYADFRRRARNVAQWLIDTGLDAERPVAILSGNDLEHAVLGMGAMYAGIPYAPVSPAYSLVSTDFAKLRHVFSILNPGLVFAADAAQFGRAIEAVVPEAARVVAVRGNGIPFASLASAEATEAVDRATASVSAESVAKILFTSGSAGVPKGVINTHGMLCSNQEMLRTVFRFIREQPPVICDWLPWHHTFGGNHNFGLVLFNGGTLYIDGGRPMAGAFSETVRNLREIATTAYFNVPKGYEMLVEHLRADQALRRQFFSQISMTFYAAAGLSQHVWDALDELAVASCGYRIPMLTGLGATETAPFAICARKETARAGVVGLPVPGVELKLVPVEGKLEARVKGPNVTPGFWRQPELTSAAFDEDGYYKLGDALRFLDADDPRKGFVFDGRIAEDFKLSTGVWVSVGPLRARFLHHAAPWVRDVVFAGHDRDEVTALIFPGDEASAATTQAVLRDFARQSTGSSTRIVRAIMIEEQPSIDAGEITDKGSINQRAVLTRRAELVERLYADPMPEGVISI